MQDTIIWIYNGCCREVYRYVGIVVKLVCGSLLDNAQRLLSHICCAVRVEPLFVCEMVYYCDVTSMAASCNGKSQNHIE